MQQANTFLIHIKYRNDCLKYFLLRHFSAWDDLLMFRFYEVVWYLRAIMQYNANAFQEMLHQTG